MKILLLFLICKLGQISTNTIYRVITLSGPDKIPIDIPWTINKTVKFYDLGIEQKLQPVALPERLTKLMKIPSLEFSIDNQKYVAYILDRLVKIENGTEICLGRFSGINITGGNIYISYENGDFSPDGIPYNSIVEISPLFFHNSRKYHIGRKEELRFHIKTPKLLEELRIKSIGFYNSAGTHEFNLSYNESVNPWGERNIAAVERLFAYSFNPELLFKNIFSKKPNNQPTAYTHMQSLNFKFNTARDSEKYSKKKQSSDQEIEKMQRELSGGKIADQTESLNLGENQKKKKENKKAQN